MGGPHTAPIIYSRLHTARKDPVGPSPRPLSHQKVTPPVCSLHATISVTQTLDAGEGVWVGERFIGVWWASGPN